MRHHADDTLLIFAAVVVALFLLGAAAGRANESFLEIAFSRISRILIAIKDALDSNKR